MKALRQLGLGLGILASCAAGDRKHEPLFRGFTNAGLTNAESRSTLNNFDAARIPPWDRSCSNDAGKIDRFVYVKFFQDFFKDMDLTEVCPYNNQDPSKTCLADAPQESDGTEGKEASVQSMTTDPVNTPFDMDLTSFYTGSGILDVKVYVEDSMQNIDFDDNDNDKSYNSSVEVDKTAKATSFDCFRRLADVGSTHVVEFHVKRVGGNPVNQPINFIFVFHYSDANNHSYRLPIIIDPTWKNYG